MQSLNSTNFPKLLQENCHEIKIGIVGEVSCGKSTLLNGIFGQLLAYAGIDRSTFNVQCYKEANMNEKDEQKIFQESKEKSEQLKKELDKFEQRIERIDKNW